MTSGILDDRSGTVPPAHPLLRIVETLEGLLDDARQANAWSLTPAELQDLLPRITRAEARLAEVELRVLHQADRSSVGDDVGATTTAHWWAHVTGQCIPFARARAVLAEKLEAGHGPVGDAMAVGRINLDQAHAIVAAVDELPADLVGPDLVADAEAHLVGLADLDGDTRLDPKALRIAGRKVLEVIAPDIAEAHEQRLLEAEEREAAATASFTMRGDGHGSVVGKFRIPELHGAVLAKHLNAIAAPRHQRATGAQPAGPGTTVARPLRWGHAFMEYLETRAATGMPKAGGVAATVVVTMTMEQLVGGLTGSDKAATLDTGEQISAATARRLACEAGIIPAVLGSRSQALDVGRKTRFHTEPQRIALMLRDGGCAVRGCDHLPGMSHAHHLTAWSRGGKTSVDNGILLCPRHHTLAHDPAYELSLGPNGEATLHRRCRAA